MTQKRQSTTVSLYLISERNVTLNSFSCSWPDEKSRWRTSSTKSRTSRIEARLDRSGKKKKTDQKRTSIPPVEKMSGHWKVSYDITCVSVLTRLITLRQTTREKESRTSWNQVRNTLGIVLSRRQQLWIFLGSPFDKFFLDSQETKWRLLLTNIWRRLRIKTYESSRLKNRWNREGDLAIQWYSQVALDDQTKVFFYKDI